MTMKTTVYSKEALDRLAEHANLIEKVKVIDDRGFIPGLNSNGGAYSYYEEYTLIRRNAFGAIKYDACYWSSCDFVNDTEYEDEVFNSPMELYDYLICITKRIDEDDEDFIIEIEWR